MSSLPPAQTQHTVRLVADGAVSNQESFLRRAESSTGRQASVLTCGSGATGGPGPSPAPRDVLDRLAAPRAHQQACTPRDRPALPNEVQCPGGQELGLVSDSSFYQEIQTSVSLHVAGVFPLDARFPGALRSGAQPLFLEDGLCTSTMLSEAGSATQVLCPTRPACPRGSKKPPQAHSSRKASAGSGNPGVLRIGACVAFPETHSPLRGRVTSRRG